MVEKARVSGGEFWLKEFDNFRKIARELREFEAYETINNLIHCLEYSTNSDGTAKDAYGKGIWITFIGDSSASEKCNFIEATFPNAARLEVEDFPGTAPSSEYYSYHEEAANSVPFIFINTPSLQDNPLPDIGEWHTEGVVFLISGKISPTEESWLNKIKYQVDNDSLFFVQTAENSHPHYNIYNLITISNILSVDEREICYCPSSESSSIAQHFTANIDILKEAWYDLLLYKIRNYMIQFYTKFEIKVETYRRSLTKLQRYQRDLQEIEDQTTKAVERINKKFIRKLDQVFSIDANYSYDIRGVIKQVNQELSDDKIKNTSELANQLDIKTQELLEDWTKKSEDIIAEYFRNISHAVRKEIDKFGYAYRSSIPLNRKIELQARTDFHVYLFQTSKPASVARLISSGVLPGYFIGKAVHTAGTTAAAIAAAEIGPILTTLAAHPIGWAILAGIVVAGAIVGVLWWYSSEDRKNQARRDMSAEGEKDMKPFNYYIAHGIRMEFEEILNFSEDALQSIFSEIRKAERKRVTINNAYPIIKAIEEDSLLDEIRKNLKSVASNRMEDRQNLPTSVR